VGLKGSALATLGQGKRPLRPSRPALGETLREPSRRKGETCPPLFPLGRRPRAWRRGQGSWPAPHIRGGRGACPSHSNPSRRPTAAPPPFSLSRLRVGEALPQKLSTISTTPSCCRSNLSLHHTCWTKEGGDITAPYVCISRRRRHLRHRIGSDREEETASTTTSTTFF
jgi:hypothetical protein